MNHRLLEPGFLERIRQLRRELHAAPELSGNEYRTAERIALFLSEAAPEVDITTGVGGAGIVAQFSLNGAGPVVALRAELDALPIEEENDLEHRSTYPGVSHACGHDGHMAMACGAALRLRERDDVSGSLVLVLQPAEETGQGADLMLADPRFPQDKLTAMVALHNIPGVPLGSVIVRSGVQTVASCGLTFRFSGRTAHAAYPEQGASPAGVIAKLIMRAAELSQPGSDRLATVVGASLGEKAFGTAPASGEIFITARGATSDSLEWLIQDLSDTAQAACRLDSIEWSVEREDEFCETINQKEVVDTITSCAENLGLPVRILENPVLWSEDFGVFTKVIPGALFGFGAGETQADLHDSRYDFPDELLGPGVCLLEEVAAALLNRNVA